MNVYGEIQLNELTSALSMADYVTILFCLLKILGIGRVNHNLYSLSLSQILIYDLPIRHGSLEDDLGSTKMTRKTKAGDGCGVMSGVQNNGF